MTRAFVLLLFARFGMAWLSSPCSPFSSSSSSCPSTCSYSSSSSRSLDVFFPFRCYISCPSSWPLCGIRRLLAPFVFFSLLLLLLLFPFLSFLLPPGGLRRPKYAWGPIFLFLFSLSRALSFFLSLFFLPLFQLLPVVPLRPFRDGVFVVSFFNFAVLFFYQV